MKITPVAGPNIGSISSSSGGPAVSADKREAAKARFLGQTPNAKIYETDSPVDPSIRAQNNNMRSIKVKTNFSTDRDQIPEVIPEQSANPDVNEQAASAEVTQPISPQLAAIAKQRRALQVKESEIAAREKALQEQGTRGVDLEKLKADPLSILQQAGVTYDQLTEAILANPSSSQIDPKQLREEIKQELKKEFDEQFNSRDTQAEKQVLTELQREADKLVATGDEFEMIRENRMQPKVVELIHRIWKQTGEVMDVQDAANLIETELLNDAIKLANLKKVQSKLTPAEAMQQQAPSRPPMRTLTNRDTASPQVSARARAIAAFHNYKK